MRALCSPICFSSIQLNRKHTNTHTHREKDCVSLIRTTYALTISPVAMSLEELIPSSHLKSHIYAIIIRTTLVVSTLLVGLAIPFFGTSQGTYVFHFQFFSFLPTMHTTVHREHLNHCVAFSVSLHCTEPNFCNSVVAHCYRSCDVTYWSFAHNACSKFLSGCSLVLLF